MGRKKWYKRGAIGGAIAGGTAGSAFGPVGTVTGAVIGAAGGAGIGGSIDGDGLKGIEGAFKDAMPGVNKFKAKAYPYNPAAFVDPNLEANRTKFQQGLIDARNRTAPSAGAASVNQVPQAQFRKGQMDLVAALQAQAAGQGPSLANAQLRQATDRNISQSMALQNSARGGNPAMAARNIGNQAANLNQQAAGQSAINRMQEQATAREQLASVLGAGRAADIGLATSDAGFAQQSGLANQDAGLRQTAMNDDMSRYYNTAGMTIEQQQIANNILLEQLRGNQSLGVAGIKAGVDAGNAANEANLLTGGLAAGGSVAAAALSDKRAKKNISGVSDDSMDEFLDALEGRNFSYKDSRNGEGRRVGIMAQDIEGTDIGSTFVRETPEGKKLDMAGGFGAVLAALGELNQRLDEIDGTSGKNKKNG